MATVMVVDMDEALHIVLETERVILRQFTEADVDNLFDLDSDPRVMHFLNGGKPTPREVVENEILPRLLRYNERRDGYGRWAAIEKANGNFLGWFSLCPAETSSPDEPELGYRLRRIAWGKGYATEVAQALVRQGFTELHAQRVVANTMTVNRASRRVMEKVGLTLVRTYHLEWPEYIDGAEHGDVEYALTKTDWERQQAAKREQLPDGH